MGSKPLPIQARQNAFEEEALNAALDWTAIARHEPLDAVKQSQALHKLYGACRRLHIERERLFAEHLMTVETPCALCGTVHP